jgi:hypothetical protein
MSKQDNNTVDRFSGKLLCSFELADFEHKILTELEYTYARFGLSAYQYMTGLARALDIVVKTVGGKKLADCWNGWLHKVDNAD